jgi:RND family efflux transporter MFP subunit
LSRERSIGTLLALAMVASPSVATASDAIELQRCAVEYERTSEVSVTLVAATSTVLQDVYVRAGDRVKSGQVLGRVQDHDARADVELWTAEANSDVDLRAETAKYSHEQVKLRRADALMRRNLLSQEDFGLAKLEAEIAGLKVEQAKHARRMAQIRLRQAESQLRAREFVNPHDGIVVEVLKNQGEMIASHEPVFRVVDVGRLKVVGHLDVADAWRVQTGQRVRITPEVEGVDLEIEHEIFTGGVVFVDSRIDPETRTCKVIAEVLNRDHRLRSGLEARMTIALKEKAGVASSPGTPESAFATPRDKSTPAGVMAAPTALDGPAK